MNGLSGDRVIILDEYVIKICQTNQERFAHNIQKQKDFCNPYIMAVPILQHSLSEGQHVILMPRKNNDGEITPIVENKLLSYLDEKLEQCQVGKFDYLTWRLKLSDLMEKIDDISIQHILRILLNLNFQQPFYYGSCHGDFTFSNLLIHQNNIYAIDFLDTFINSPVLDLVKLRQETRSVQLEAKLQIMIDSDPILTEYYLPFTILNFVRILPYAKDSQTLQNVKNRIHELYHTFNSGCR